MSNILENLARILNARYGKDVRQSIHDAILNCYEDGKAGAIDLEARADIAEEVQNRQQADESINQSIDDITEVIDEIQTDMADLQPKTDAELTTESKEIVGAVNELNKNLAHFGANNVAKMNFGWENGLFYTEWYFADDNIYRHYLTSTEQSFYFYDGSKWTKLW